jgi:nitroreductase
METWDAITSRRNVRSYASRPVSPEHLDRILEAARRSPSSQNSQPWDFVLVTGRDLLEQLSQVWVGAGHIASSAATVALVVPEDKADRVRFDLGQVTMSIMLAAADLGIGSCHSAPGDHDQVSRLLGLPAAKRCGFFVSLGYPAGRPLAPIRNPDRRPFDQLVHRERW